MYDSQPQNWEKEHTPKKYNYYPVPIKFFFFFSEYCNTMTDFLSPLSLSLLVSHTLCRLLTAMCILLWLFAASLCVRTSQLIQYKWKYRGITRFCQNQNDIAHTDCITICCCWLLFLIHTNTCTHSLLFSCIKTSTHIIEKIGNFCLSFVYVSKWESSCMMKSFVCVCMCVMLAVATVFCR